MSDKIFYTIPFRTERLVNKGKLDRSDLLTSVRQNLRLLLMTPPLRMRYDPFFGCRIHWFQFLLNNRIMEGKKEEEGFKQRIEENIEKLVLKFEPRIVLREVNVSIRFAVEDHTKWQLTPAERTQNVIQMLVSLRGDVNPDLAYGQSLQLEDTIPLL
jgi:phage baseplate assembly protein W